jgi:Flp pilus assembly protein TadG
MRRSGEVHMKIPVRGRSGSILVMVTVALFAMCGLLGLAVDLGWSFYVKKSAQAAADAAAIAGLTSGYSRIKGTSAPYSCPGSGTTTLWCSAPVRCATVSTSSNLYSACSYAAANGFADGASHISVYVEGEVTPSSVTRLDGSTVNNLSYWVRVSVNETVPQLFSSFLGNTSGTVSARATAAITTIPQTFSLQLLNRLYENVPCQEFSTVENCALYGFTGNNGAMQGVSLGLGGGPFNIGLFPSTLSAPNGMYVSSSAAGTASLQFGSQVNNTPFSDFNGGTCTDSFFLGLLGGPCGSDWNQPWKSSGGASADYLDPTTGTVQPPISSSLLGTPHAYAVMNNGLSQTVGITGSGTAASPYVLPPGIYYGATGASKTPTLAPLNFDGGSAGTVYYTLSNSNSPGEYVFVGGLNATAVATTNITVGSGEVVLAGTNTVGNPLFQIGANTTIQDGGTSSAGELFVFTDGGNGGYPNLSSLLTGNIPGFTPAMDTSLHYGQGGITCTACASGTDNSSISLNGVNASQISQLSNYSNFLMWQDRGDSHVLINPDGSINTGSAGVCGPGSSVEQAGAAPSINDPCTNPNADTTNSTKATDPQQMNLSVNSRTKMNGTIYQPRGGWIQMNNTGSGTTGGNLQIITGALSLSNSNGGGSGTVNLAGDSKVINVPKNVLIE